MNKILFAAVLFTRTQVLMGDVPVTLNIEAATSKKTAAYSAMETAFDRARTIEQEVSEFIPTSQTSLLNRNAGNGWMPIGKDLSRILELSLKISGLTDGAFDVTFASPDNTATFRDIELQYDKSPPTPLFSARGGSATGGQRGERRDFKARLRRKGTKIAVSGIAKGYIVDRMADILRENGFKKFLVDAGGELYASGQWKVGLRGLKTADGASLTLKNQAASTSGLSERGNHIVDPRTDRPIIRDLSVTVIAKESFVADAWDTTAFVMGKEKLEMIRDKIPDVQFIFVENGQIN